MTSAADLFALQEIDLRRDARRAVIADVESRMGETDELIEARESVGDAEAALERLKKRQRDLDNELTDLDAKIRPLETRLYDGSVRNPKELSDMQKEFESLKARRGVLDDSGLAMLESNERATKALREAEAEYKATEAAWRKDQAQLKATKETSEAEMARLNADREARVKGMDAGAIGLYENLRAKHQGRAVAVVLRDVCQGCRISLPSHMVQRMRAGATVQCTSCERILVAG
jgi:predicted  nucleic acid-binding Zn-ribbon protein